MPWWAWLIVANGAVVFNEYVARRGSYDSFIAALPLVFVPTMLIQCGIFYGYRGAPSFMLGWAVYFVLSVCLRFGNALAVGEPPTVLTVLGVLVVVFGAVLIKLGSV